MSRSAFKRNFVNSMSKLSQESGEVFYDEVPTVQERLDDLFQNSESSSDGDLDRELAEDEKYLKASDVVTDVVAQAAVAAETMPPAVADSFVSTANCIINDASKVIGTEIPLLKNDDDGSVSKETLISLRDWFGCAGHAFNESASMFYARLALYFSRQNARGKHLAEELARIKLQVEGNGSKGDVDINLPRSVLPLLVWENDYSPAPGDHLTAFAATTIPLIQTTVDYYERLGEFITAVDSVFSAASATLVSQVKNDDLIKRIEDTLEAQQPPLLGNVKYVKGESGLYPVTDVDLTSQSPLAEQLVETLPLIRSFTDEEAAAIIVAAEVALDAQMVQLERVTSTCVAVFQRIANLGSDVVDETTNPTEIIRLQSNLLSEVSDICKTLLGYQLDLFDRIEAVKIWVAESLIQDSNRG